MRSIILGLMLTLAACRTESRIPPNAGLRDGLSAIGTLVESPAPSKPATATVVLIADLHPLHGGISRSRDAFYAVRRDLAAAVEILVRDGYRLLGCEWREGPLPEGGAAEAHREAYRRAVADRDDVDVWTLFQPIRLEQQFLGRLVVWGVEDAALYDADVERLAQIRRLLAKNEASPADAARVKSLETEIRSQSQRRGRQAASALLRVMRERNLDRAGLLLGRAHLPAAESALSEAGVRVLTFESEGVRRWLETR